MEQLMNTELILDIEEITAFRGGDEWFEIDYLTKEKEAYRLSFSWVWDVHYSIENGFIDRFYRLRMNLQNDIIDNGIYIVIDSEYIKRFANEISGTRPLDDLKDYIISDRMNTVIELLTCRNPVLARISEPTSLAGAIYR